MLLRRVFTSEDFKKMEVEKTRIREAFRNGTLAPFSPSSIHAALQRSEQFVGSKSARTYRSQAAGYLSNETGRPLMEAFVAILDALSN
jgi:hypothetical protein